jgi:hypothetical protein
MSSNHLPPKKCIKRAWNKNAHMRVCCNVYNFSRPGHKGDHSLGIKSAKINKPTPLSLSRMHHRQKLQYTVAAATRITMSNLHAKRPPCVRVLLPLSLSRACILAVGKGGGKKIILQCRTKQKGAQPAKASPCERGWCIFCARICINPFASPHVCSPREL